MAPGSAHAALGRLGRLSNPRSGPGFSTLARWPGRSFLVIRWVSSFRACRLLTDRAMSAGGPVGHSARWGSRRGPCRALGLDAALHQRALRAPTGPPAPVSVEMRQESGRAVVRRGFRHAGRPAPEIKGVCQAPRRTRPVERHRSERAAAPEPADPGAAQPTRVGPLASGPPGPRAHRGGLTTARWGLHWLPATFGDPPCEPACRS
jgi:hypothetical protein